MVSGGAGTTGKAAKVLCLDMPPTVLARADESSSRSGFYIHKFAAPAHDRLWAGAGEDPQLVAASVPQAVRSG
jgi:hypothetical protein